METIPSGLEPIVAANARPFWSVIVPVHNRQEYLKQCLDSVLDQDPGPAEMEILVVDDASSNDMRGIVETLGRGRVQYSRNPVNLGQHATTNLAIQKTSGRWIHILHDDDWVMSGFYDTLRRGLETAPQSVGLAFCMYSTFDQTTGTLWSPQPFRASAGVMAPTFVIRLAQINSLNFPAVVYRRETFEAVGLFREDLPCASDWEFFVRAGLRFDWHHQPENLARYRINSGNLTIHHKMTGQRARDFRRVLDEFARMLPVEVAAAALAPARELHARKFMHFVQGYLKANNYPLAVQFLTECLKIDPDLAGRPEFAELLKQPEAAQLRHQIRTDLLRAFE